MSSPPDNYNTYRLPEVRFSHHPASSSSVTPVVLVILDRPSARNAWTIPMADSLEKAFTLLAADTRVKAVVLTGGDQTNTVFCPGMDLTQVTQRRANLNKPETPREAYRDGGGRVALAIHRCPKPVIAAINGHAVGVGITMTLPASIRIVSDRAKVGFVFARRGINMEACSSFFLPRLIGTSRAMHLVTTGGVFPATSHLFGGLFGEVVPPEEVLPRALALAGELTTSVSGLAAQLSKELMYRGPGSPEEAHLLESSLFYDLMRGPDSEEGARSFKEKRAPDFRATVDKDAPEVYPWWGSETDEEKKEKKEEGDKSKL